MTIEQLFWRLGIHMGTVGCKRALSAIGCVLEDEDKLVGLVEHVYIPTGEKYGCHWKVVERNLRTVILRGWKQNPELMQQLAGYRLDRQPRVGEFLGMVYNFMARQDMRV